MRAGEPSAAHTTITLPIPTKGRWSVEVHVVYGAVVPFAPTSTPASTALSPEGALTIAGERWTRSGGASCMTLPPKVIELTPPSTRVTLEATGGAVALDYLALRKLSTRYLVAASRGTERATPMR